MGIATRQGYGLTESDDATGLDHTWFRKNESSAGRWTSPDPYKGSMTVDDPQSFNRYSYVQSDPLNFVDPSGLRWRLVCNGVYDENGGGDETCYMVNIPDSPRWGWTPREREYPATQGDPHHPTPQTQTNCDLFNNGSGYAGLQSFMSGSYGSGVGGKSFSGQDIFTFARVIYAESSNDDEERDAIGSVFISRVVSQNRPTLSSLANSGQFQSVTGKEAQTRAFRRVSPENVDGLSDGDCESLKKALSVALQRATQGPKPEYAGFGSFRGGTSPLRPGMTVIGNSRFAASDSVFNPPRTSPGRRRTN